MIATVFIAIPFLLAAGAAFCVWYYLHYTNEVNRRVQNHVTDGKAMLPPGATIAVTAFAEMFILMLLLLALLFLA